MKLSRGGKKSRGAKSGEEGVFIREVLKRNAHEGQIKTKGLLREGLYRAKLGGRTLNKTRKDKAGRGQASRKQSSEGTGSQS